MNLNPLNWLPGRGKALPGAVENEGVSREVSQHPYSIALNGYVPREVNPWLYEAIREAVAPIDGAINRIVTLDGIIRFEAESDRLQQQLEDWADNVRVNDKQHGLQAFYQSQGNELYEQGFTIGTFGYSADGRDVERLRVADSKGVIFHRDTDDNLNTYYRKPAPRSGRRDGMENIERILRNSYHAGSMMEKLEGYNYRLINPELEIYGAFNVEADNPYGTSIMRSTEFLSKVLATMDNATHRVWERFGDPMFEVTLKRASRQTDDLDTCRRTLATAFHNVLNAKRNGNSADFVSVIGKDDTLEVNVIGGEGEVLTIEAPARHVLEQIVSKMGIPSWMLGFHWSTAERLAERQGEIALQESRTRFESRRRGLTYVTAAALRARGVTWKPGEWRLTQELPNLQDLVAKAQAGFLEAQTEMMLRDGGMDLPAETDDEGKVLLPTDPGYNRDRARRQKKSLESRLKQEGFAEDGDALEPLETKATRDMQAKWRGLLDDTLSLLELPRTRKAEDEFQYDPSHSQTLREMAAAFAIEIGDDNSALAASLHAAFGIGAATAASELDVEAIVEEARRGYEQALSQRGLELVRNATARAYEDDVLAELQRGAYDGMNPRDVARALRNRFSAHEVDWERIARTEITTAHADAKQATYQQHGVTEYEYVTAGDSRVSSICRSLAAGSPYPVGNGPIPGRDSHPNCRCSTKPVVPDDD